MRVFNSEYSWHPIAGSEIDDGNKINQEPRSTRTGYETATFGFLKTPQGAGNLPLSD